MNIILHSAAMDSSWSGNVGKVEVRELDWVVPQQAEDAGGPFDFVVAADCIYHEQIVEHFLRTVLAITDHRSTGVALHTVILLYNSSCKEQVTVCN